MQKKKKLNVLLLIVMSGLLVYFAITFSKQQEEINMIENEMKVLKNKIAKEKEIQEELLEQQSIIETDEFIEKIAREKLGMVKEGERIYVDMDQ
ncbi:MAG: septum formation initiator family protein [Clostridiaceae bacterium]|nr:septum formation initiator family protein [Clostridiaceae bacterium]